MRRILFAALAAALLAVPAFAMAQEEDHARAVLARSIHRHPIDLRQPLDRQTCELLFVSGAGGKFDDIRQSPDLLAGP